MLQKIWNWKRDSPEPTRFRGDLRIYFIVPRCFPRRSPDEWLNRFPSEVPILALYPPPPPPAAVAFEVSVGSPAGDSISTLPHASLPAIAGCGTGERPCPRSSAQAGPILFVFDESSAPPASPLPPHRSRYQPSLISFLPWGFVASVRAS